MLSPQIIRGKEIIMTLLAMWLDEKSVALATDSRMSEPDGRVLNDDVRKQHCLPSGKVMFGIGFGEGASQWLSSCPCEKHPCYPEHWSECSKAENTDELERVIRNDLNSQGLEPTSLQLCVAGINEKGNLEAFVLDGTGRRAKELVPDQVFFSPDSIEFLGVLLQLEPLFRKFKKEMDNKQTEFSGAEALKKTGDEIIRCCRKLNYPHIGGEIRYQVIPLERQNADQRMA
jgi:hypothetical protein